MAGQPQGAATGKSSGFLSELFAGRGYVYSDESGVPICNKRSPLTEAFYRFNAYSKLAVHLLRGGLSPSYLIRTRYPYSFPDQPTPPVVSLELSSACNLTCNYCPVPQKVRKVEHMSMETIDRIVESLAAMKKVRVHLRGWGEATLHPRFPEIARRIAQVSTYVDLVTNGQWLREEVSRALIEAPVDRIDISVQAGGEQSHADHRGGDLAILERNLRALRAHRARTGGKSIIIVRIMFLPSQAHLIEPEKRRWRELADTVIPAPVFRKSHEEEHLDYGDDIFTLSAKEELYPKCYFPFNELHVSANGKIPLCDALIFKKDGKDVYTESVHNSTLTDIWNSAPHKRLRSGQRTRTEEDMRICEGCSTC